MLLIGEAAVTVAALFPQVSPGYRAYYIDHTSDVWPPCKPAPDQLPKNGTIEPGRLSPKAACALLRYGWSQPESWAVWNEGKIARLVVPYGSNNHILALTLEAHAPPGQTQGLTVLVGGHAKGHFLIPSHAVQTVTVALPSTDQPAVADIELFVAHPYSPVVAGEGPDGRPLGVALIRLDRR